VEEPVTDLASLRGDALEAIAAADDLDELDAVRVRFTGKRSRLAELQAQLRDLDPDERKERGQELNAFRGAFQAAYDTRREELASAALAVRLEAERLDLTLPPRRPRPGRPHLLTQEEQEMLDVFGGMG
jgi:phenylalanyl-tRNA synthetase alpha chain